MKRTHWTFHLPDHPVVMLVAGICAMITILIPNYHPSFDMFHIWYISPTFNSSTRFLLNLYIFGIGGFTVASFLLERFRPSFAPGKPTPYSFWAGLFAGPREEPVYNWLYIYVLSTILTVFDRFTGKRLSTTLQPVFILWTELFPYVPKENVWAAAIALFGVSIYFGIRHIRMYPDRPRLGTVFLTGGLNFLVGAMNYSLGLWCAMVVHSSYDTVLYLLDRFLLKKVYQSPYE